MKMPRVRFTVGWMMIAVAVAAVLLAAINPIFESPHRRRGLRSFAEFDRGTAADFREAAVRLRSAPPDHRRGCDCGRCEGASWFCRLQPHVASRAEGIAALEAAASLLDRSADGYEASAVWPWGRGNGLTAAERASYARIMGNRGDVVVQYEHSTGIN